MLIAGFQILQTIVALASCVSIGYSLLCVWTVLRFAPHGSSARANSSQEAVNLTPVSILKPLKGADPEMYEALRSHCTLDYPEYELLFGIADEHDPAVPLVERLIREFPNRRIRLVRCEKKLGANGKVSTLAQLASVASHEIVLVNDSDIRVESEYLRTVVNELQQAGVGLVTCLYRGAAARNLGSRLESLGISTDFAPGVLAARLIEGGLHFGLGSTLAFRKRDLVLIGGFEVIMDYLADDYELGRRIAEYGLRVELSEAIVETHLPAYDLTGFFSHQLRWARTIRASRPGGYWGLLLTFTIPWALASLLLTRGAGWAWWFFGFAIAARTLTALGCAGLVLRDPAAFRSIWLLPLRDLLAVSVWLGGFAGRKIVWRGETFTLHRGKLNRVQ